MYTIYFFLTYSISLLCNLLSIVDLIQPKILKPICNFLSIQKEFEVCDTQFIKKIKHMHSYTVSSEHSNRIFYSQNSLTNLAKIPYNIQNFAFINFGRLAKLILVILESKNRSQDFRSPNLHSPNCIFSKQLVQITLSNQPPSSLMIEVISRGV